MSHPAPGLTNLEGDTVGSAGGKPRLDPSPSEDKRFTLFWALRRCAVILFGLAGYSLAVIHRGNFSFDLFFKQDAPVLGVTAALLLGINAWPRLLRHAPSVRVPPISPALMIAFVFVVALSGTWLVFGNFDLTRDEFMANFDASVFASGRRAWPISLEWRPFDHALMPLFMRDIPAEAGWISSYLPGNAMLRALAEQTVGREFTGPILAAIAVFTLWRIALRLWPEAPRTALLPVLLLSLSPQFLVTAMTPFAMTAHLTFNLLWLLCFLQDNRRGDAGALACGFIATGLHQLVFHPMFAAPFVAELLIARRFRRATVFIVAYALIGLFWVLYPQLILPVSTGTNLGGGGVGAGLAQLIGGVGALLSTFNVANIVLMLLNLLRFAAWQHLLLLTLVLCAWPAIRGAQGIARPLLVGAILTLLVTFLIMPFQGYGWGYRYLHGFLGSFCLLACYGWQRLYQFAAERRAVLTLTSAATVGLILPFQMASTRAIIEPYRVASASIQSSNADVVLVDGAQIPFSVNVVRNPARLNGRPKVMDIASLTQPQLRYLCTHYNVRLFDTRHAVQAGILPASTRGELNTRAHVRAIVCDKPLPLSRGNDGVMRR